MPRLFDSFFSTKSTGMGLGLSIVRTLVEAHGGRVTAENGVDGGAVFRVEWPAAGANNQEEHGAGMKDKRSTPLIHVVDDDEPLRTALLRLLAAAGFEAQGHASAGDFLLYPVPDRPGCLLLDVRMPGPSGLDLQAALPEHGVGLPIIFMTGHADVPTSVRAMKAGAVDFLEKPVQRQNLLDAIGRALVRDERQRRERDDRDRLRERFALLSPREQEVLEQVVAGKLNKQIAAALQVSERTIKTLRAQVHGQAGRHLVRRTGNPCRAVAPQLRTLNPGPRATAFLMQRKTCPLGKSASAPCLGVDTRLSSLMI